MSQNDYHMKEVDGVVTLLPTLGADEPSETQKLALKSKMERMRAEIAAEAAAVEERASALDEREARLAAREAALTAAAVAVNPPPGPTSPRVESPKQKKE